MLQMMEKNGAEPYLQQFEKFEKEPKQPSWVFPLRKAGSARFAELGFPTLNHEDWRFTNGSSIAKRPFIPLFRPFRCGLSATHIGNCTFGNLPATRPGFVNGHYAAAR